MQITHISGTQPNIEHENVAQSENLTSSVQSVQPAGNVKDNTSESGKSGVSEGNTEGKQCCNNAISAVNAEASVSEDAGSRVMAFLDQCEDDAQADAEDVAKAAAAKRTAMWKSALPDSLLNPPADNPLFLHGESIVMIRGTLVALKGRAKVGKSQFYGYLTAALLKDGVPVGDSGLRAACAGLKVLIIDTEMTQAQGVAKVQRGFRAAGVPIPDAPSSDRVTILFVKSRPPKEIIAITEAAIADLQPDLVVIDGIVQLFPSFNDEEEANNALNWLKGLTLGECEPCVIAVLHTNLSDKDTSAGAKMRGHLGTQLELSADTIISVSKKDRIFTAEIPDGRRPEDCKISWEIDNEHGMYIPARDPSDTGREKDLLDHFEEIRNCMIQLAQEEKPTTQAAIIRLYKHQTDYGKTAAYNHFKACKDAGLIVLGIDNNYSTPQREDQVCSGK